MLVYTNNRDTHIQKENFSMLKEKKSVGEDRGLLLSSTGTNSLKTNSGYML